MSGDAVDKRFKVVRDADGDWGILDTVAAEFDGVPAFASWGAYKGVTYWVDEIVDWAANLNTRDALRDDFSWSEYVPREVAA
ncbi:hypothetical protein SEA_FORK_106 [Microbacterium phage Fork]|nr:hypothetical protein SEA_FORK_106 [Microbacterium phage Fork]QYC54229.1 hypothetical protein SEA_WELCOME_112 [Microbacterium phage Welcome]WNO26000.1 hypothetical protein SEA_ASEGATO_108 [Microbacterium phage ASegato]